MAWKCRIRQGENVTRDCAGAGEIREVMDELGQGEARGGEYDHPNFMLGMIRRAFTSPR